MRDLDGDFAGVAAAKVSAAARAWKWTFRTVLAVPVAVTLLYVVKPFRLTERLNHPVAVKSVSARALVLEDGSRVTLPYIKRIPWDDPVFRTVLAQGVERAADGQLYGLLTVVPSCGMEIYRDCTYRVSLTDVAAVLDAANLDAAKVDPELVRSAAGLWGEKPSNPRRIRDWFLFDVRRMARCRADFEALKPSAASPSEGPLRAPGSSAAAPAPRPPAPAATRPSGP